MNKNHRTKCSVCGTFQKGEHFRRSGLTGNLWCKATNMRTSKIVFIKSRGSWIENGKAR